MAKIRSDFVSNSSSSSFAFVGMAFDDDEIVAAYKKVFPDKDTDEPDGYDGAEKIAEKIGLDFTAGIENFYDNYIIGLSIEQMKDDETLGEFKAKVKEGLEKAFDNAKPEILIDGGMEC
jgi:hypothetical protein